MMMKETKYAIGKDMAKNRCGGAMEQAEKSYHTMDGIMMLSEKLNMLSLSKAKATARRFHS